MRKLSNKKIAAVAAGAVILTGTGVAYAYWTTVGAGSGSATAGAPIAGDAIILAQDSVNTGFYPGGPVQDVDITAENPADFNQVVGEVTVSLTGSVACPAGNWDLINVADAFGNVAANTTSAAQKVATLQLKETELNQDGCKGAIPTLTFASVGGE